MANPVFNPSLVGRTFVGRQVTIAYPLRKKDASQWATEIAMGINFWTTINIIALPLVALLYVVGIISMKATGVAFGLFVGIPMFMLLGYVFGYFFGGVSYYLTWREVFQTIGRYFRG